MGSEFPRLRWAVLAWMAVWVPAYWVAWGPANFLLLCDIAMVIALVAVWRGSALLLSSQAVATIFVGVVWLLDFLWRLTTGGHLIGGTEYLWDAQYPLGVRLLSFYHVGLPLLLVWCLRRVGYDRRGWLLQAGIAAAVLVLSRFFDPAKNMNFAFTDPILRQQLGPAPVHLLIIFSALVGVIYWPTHRLLARWLPAARPPRAR